jgi:predicted Zn-ribbon and HTH transcriptional regulator
MLRFESFTCNEVIKMEKGRVGNKRKSTKKTYDIFETELDKVKDVVNNSTKKLETKKANPKCTKCGTEMNHVKTSGLLAVFKCPNCKFTIDQWV